MRTLADLSSVEKTIDRWLRPIALTGFVEPLQLAAEIAVRLDKARPGSSSSLFFMSDGMDNQNARKQVLEQAKLAGQAFAASTFVEYGYYADRALLSEMAAQAGGTLIFAEGLAEYEPQLEKAMKSAPAPERSLYAVPPEALGGIAFARSGSDLLTFAVSPDAAGTPRATAVPAHLESVYFLTDREAGTPSGESVRSLAWAEPMYAALSLFSVRAEPLVVRGILRALADVRFIDAFSGCFGKQRYSAFMQSALAAAIDPSVRWVGGIDENHLPSPNAFTVLDMLRLLEGDEEARILFDPPSFRYARFGRARIDASQVLTDEEQAEVSALQAKIAGTKNGKLIAEYSQRIAQISAKPEPLKFIADGAPDGVPISGLVYNEETPNVSVRVRREGHVDISALQGAAAFGTFSKMMPSKFPTFQFRSYAIVKDGLLNVDVLPMTVSVETFMKLFALHQQKMIPDALVKAVGEAKSGKQVVLIQLGLLPLVNDEMVTSVSAQQMFENEFALLSVQAAQKVYKSAHAELSQTRESKSFVQAYGQAGADFLRDLGFTDYGGFNPSVRLETAKDYYLAKELSVSIKGFSSLPSYNAFKEQLQKSKLSTAARLMLPAHERVEAARAKLSKHPDKLADWIKAEERMLDVERRALLEKKAQQVFSLVVGQGWFTDCPNPLEPAQLTLTLTGPGGALFAGLVCTAKMGERKVEI